MYKNYLHIRSITPKGWAINLDKYAEWSEKDLEIISNELLKIKNHYNTHPRTLKWFLDRISENNIINVVKTGQKLEGNDYTNGNFNKEI